MSDDKIIQILAEARRRRAEAPADTVTAVADLTAALRQEVDFAVARIARFSVHLKELEKVLRGGF